MPTFRITIDADDGPDHLDPMDFRDAKAASDDAQVALAEMAKERLPTGKRASFGVHIEDEAGKSVYRATLIFEAEIDGETGRPDDPGALSR